MMTRITTFANPLMLGFDEIDRFIDRLGKDINSGYPPYNIERIASSSEEPEQLRLTLAIAGFERDEVDVVVEDRELIITGAQKEDHDREYLFRGIASRQFRRVFLLADGIEVTDAELKNGLLVIKLAQPPTQRLARKIEIKD